MSTTVVPLNEQLHLAALNLYPEVVLQRNLLHYEMDLPTWSWRTTVMHYVT